MWVEKVKNGYKFIERYTDPLTGRYKRVSVVLDKNNRQTQKQAQEALYEKIQGKLSEENTENITLSQLVDKYRAYQKKTVKASTYSRNYHSCESIKRMLGSDILVNKINAGYIVERLMKTGKSHGTLNEHLKRIKALLRWGYRNDYIKDVSYLDKIKNFKDDPHRVKIEDKYMENKELKELINGMDVERWKMLTEFLALSGLRFGECAALLISDIDFKEKKIHVNKNYDAVNEVVTSTKTETSTRDVFMQEELYELCRKIVAHSLEYVVAGVNKDKLLFFSKRGKHLQYYSYNKYLKENSLRILGREITAHTLRHTHASLLMENGIRIESISRRLGHSDSQVTKQIYLHVTNALEERENEQIKDIKML